MFARHEVMPTGPSLVAYNNNGRGKEGRVMLGNFHFPAVVGAAFFALSFLGNVGGAAPFRKQFPRPPVGPPLTFPTKPLPTVTPLPSFSGTIIPGPFSSPFGVFSSANSTYGTGYFSAYNPYTGLFYPYPYNALG